MTRFRSICSQDCWRAVRGLYSHQSELSGDYLSLISTSPLLVLQLPTPHCTACNGKTASHHHSTWCERVLFLLPFQSNCMAHSLRAAENRKNILGWHQYCEHYHQPPKHTPWSIEEPYTIFYIVVVVKYSYVAWALYRGNKIRRVPPLMSLVWVLTKRPEYGGKQGKARVKREECMIE